MKIRNSFVSNSSSSSFIVIGKKPEGCGSAKLNSSQKNAILVYLGVDNIEDIKDDVYLTQYFSDCGENYYSFNIDYEYVEGSHSGPYCKDDYDKISGDDYGSVWILKEHNRAELLSADIITFNNAIGILKEVLSNGDNGYDLVGWFQDQREFIKTTIEDLEKINER